MGRSHIKESRAFNLVKKQSELIDKLNEERNVQHVNFMTLAASLEKWRNWFYGVVIICFGTYASLAFLVYELHQTKSSLTTLTEKVSYLEMNGDLNAKDIRCNSSQSRTDTGTDDGHPVNP